MLSWLTMNKAFLIPTVAVVSAILVFAVNQRAVFAAIDPNLDITFVSSDGGKLTMTVAGTAGGTEGKTGFVLAYVFSTNIGLIAVASHPGFSDSNEGDGAGDWHSHKVSLDGNGCINGIDDTGRAKLSGNTVTATGTDAQSVDAGLTAKLEVTYNADGSISSVCVSRIIDSQAAS
jgi:hypothetical protein